ncbi:sensor histidine kinase [Pacificimonas sp. ICDLI1SI03]
MQIDDPPMATDREEERLSVLRELRVLDSVAEEATDATARAAARAFDAPVGLITLVEKDRQWFKARHGTELTETPRDISFCTYAIQQPDRVMVVPDAQEDPRLRNNPLVTGDFHLRFYAGAPIIVRGQPVGTLCILDTEPRHDIGDNLIEMLGDLARVVALGLETRLLTERAERLEAEQHVGNARFALALEAADMSVWSWDVDSGLLTDFGRGDDTSGMGSMTPKDFLDAVHDNDRYAVIDAFAAARSGAEEFRAEFRMAHDPERWLLSVGRTIRRNADGRVMSVTGVQTDITAQKRHDAVLETTTQEMRHRVNNLIGLADALAGRTARETESKEDFLALYRSRLQALARTQRMLMSGEGGAKLTDLAEAVIAPFRRQDRSVLILNLPDVVVTNAITQVLTLAFHELTTNALKYGALRWPTGKIDVVGRMEGETLYIDWSEFVNDAANSAPFDDYVEIASSNSGKSIVERMVGAHGGTITFDFGENGLIAKLMLPLE